jgi:hypothetical protein
VQILHIAFFEQFSLPKDVSQVFGDNRALSSEQLGHVRRDQPDRILFQPNIQTDFTVQRLVEYGFTPGVYRALRPWPLGFLR